MGVVWSAHVALYHGSPFSHMPKLEMGLIRLEDWLTLLNGRGRLESRLWLTNPVISATMEGGRPLEQDARLPEELCP